MKGKGMLDVFMTKGKTVDKQLHEYQIWDEKFECKNLLLINLIILLAIENRLKLLEKKPELDLFVKVIKLRNNNKAKKTKIYDLFSQAIKSIKNHKSLKTYKKLSSSTRMPAQVVPFDKTESEITVQKKLFDSQFVRYQ